MATIFVQGGDLAVGHPSGDAFGFAVAAFHHDPEHFDLIPAIRAKWCSLAEMDALMVAFLLHKAFIESV